MSGIAFVGLLLISGAATAQEGVAGAEAGAAASPPIVFENDYVRWEIGADGRNLRFVDRSAQNRSDHKDYMAQNAPQAFAVVKQAGKEHNASKAVLEDEQLTVWFGESGVKAVIRAVVEKHYLRLEVVRVNGDNVEELTFVNAQLSLKGKSDESFVACTLALNLKTNVPEIPGPNSRLRAMCYPRFGLQGAQAAVIACPRAELRNVMKEAVSAADELPRSSIGGPWALDADINRGSYLFDFGALTEKTVDDWIACVKSLGMNQIDFHTGTSLRFGDCAPNPDLFPQGRASVKAVLDKLHAAGIVAGLHTYAFFIDKKTPYVTPDPDPRLGKDATFTLAEALTSDSAAVPVVETTKDMSTTTGFFVRNSVTLQIDDELIIYSALSKEPPFAFTGCQRGAYGTKAATHAKGSKVHHLKECFGLFTPDADSTLLSEVAANTATTFNECGFDMIYLDALDGEDILAGAENAWHYGSKFVFEIAKRLKKPALFEMSTFHHHLWYVRARMGAWDHPTRSHKGYIDVHCAANDSGRGTFLPMNLGWWAVQVWDDGPEGTQKEPTFPDDIEYLMCKCIGTDTGLSLMGVDPTKLAAVPAYRRLAPIFKQYEELRHAKIVPKSVKAKLRTPGEDFTLENTPDGKWQFRPVQYNKHKVQGLDGWSNAWTATNQFAAQPVQLRIEALLSAAPYGSPEGQVIEDFEKPTVFADRASEAQVSATIESSSAQAKIGKTSGLFAATSERPKADGAWTKVAKTFAPPLKIPKLMALGVWVYGDGQGELLNLQLKSPQSTVHLGYGDHYAQIDFTGWRYYEFIEPEGGNIAKYAWPYSGSAYAIYRETVDYSQVETLSLWYNLLPTGKKVACYVSPIKALPVVKNKLRNPKLSVGGKTITFPVEIESGSYLEFRSMEDCKLYGPKGDLTAEVKPQGDVPSLAAGENRVEFVCDGTAGPNPRAYVTVISRGEPFRE